MRTFVIKDSDEAMSDVVLFRGEVRSLPTRPAHWVMQPPVAYVDYAVQEVLWGSLADPTVHTRYASSHPCGTPPALTLNAEVFVLCWASRKACESPVPATDENSKRIRDSIQRAKLRQRKVDVSPEQAEARLIHKVKPTYPDVAKLARIQGDVVLQIEINARGRVINSPVVSGHPLLAAAAISAVQQWRYNPFFLNGTPARAVTSVTIHYKL